MDKTLLFAGGRADPSVVRSPGGGYLMYLNRFGDDGVGTYVLRSRDGIAWETASGILFQGIATGRGLETDRGIRFYYPAPERLGRRPGEPPAPRNVVSSFSPDGITSWQYEGTLLKPAAGYKLTGPTVVRLADGSYRMFVAEVDLGSIGGVLVSTIWAASSPDGLSWVRDNHPAIEHEATIEGSGREYDRPQVLHPFVMPWPDGGYLMLYNSHTRVFAAHSPDALSWHKLGYTGIGGADADAMLLPDGSLRVYYGGWCEGEPECADAGPGVVHTSLLRIELPAAPPVVSPDSGAKPATGRETPAGHTWEPGFLRKPEGAGPFPAVMYHHGGFGGDLIGGAPEETCPALARDGYVGFAPLRSQGTTWDQKLDYIARAVDYLKGLDYVDPDRIAIMGFSQGGFLTFLSAARSPTYMAVVIMAAAVEILQGYLDEVDGISAPVLLLISENDRARQDHVQAMVQLREALESAGKDVRMIIYPPYGNDGHRMFFEIGGYWDDIRSFLEEHL